MLTVVGNRSSVPLSVSSLWSLNDGTLVRVYSAYQIRVCFSFVNIAYTILYTYTCICKRILEYTLPIFTITGRAFHGAFWFFSLQTAFIHLTKLQVAVATNPTHYGNPSTGCESDEQAVRVQGLSGDFCSPKCDSTGSCPSDVPKGDTATPECALRTTTGDKYCALICQSDSDCGSQVAFQMFALKSMNERDREACTQTFFPCSLTVGMLPHVSIHASWNLWIVTNI